MTSPIIVKEGLTANGMSLGKSQLRGPKEDLKNDSLRDPLQLTVDVIVFILTLLFSPFYYIVRRLFRQPKSLQGKVCLVTGSGRGLGRETCKVLAREGAIVACTDVNEQNNNETAGIINSMGAKAKAYKLNVADKQEVEEVTRKIENELGPIYLLVNNAAILMPAIKASEEYIRAIFNVNAIGPIWTTETLLPRMMERGEGHIANVSSVAGLYGIPFLQYYSATKAALTAYSQAIRLQLKINGIKDIHITCYHPSFINTSADYIDLLDSRLRISSVEMVAENFVNAIKCNKGDSTPHPIVYYCLCLARFISAETIWAFLKILNLEVVLPSEEEFSKLPSAGLVKIGNAI